MLSVRIPSASSYSKHREFQVLKQFEKYSTQVNCGLSLFFYFIFYTFFLKRIIKCTHYYVCIKIRSIIIIRLEKKNNVKVNKPIAVVPKAIKPVRSILIREKKDYQFRRKIISLVLLRSPDTGCMASTLVVALCRFGCFGFTRRVVCPPPRKFSAPSEVPWDFQPSETSRLPHWHRCCCREHHDLSNMRQEKNKRLFSVPTRVYYIINHYTILSM